SGQHFKAAIAHLDGENSSFWLGLGRDLGNVMDALLYCFSFSGGGTLNHKTSLAYEPRHLLTGRTETPPPSLDLRLAQGVIMAPRFAQEDRSTARADGRFGADDFGRDLRTFVVAYRAAVETANEPL